MTMFPFHKPKATLAFTGFACIFKRPIVEMCAAIAAGIRDTFKLHSLLSKNPLNEGGRRAARFAIQRVITPPSIFRYVLGKVWIVGIAAFCFQYHMSAGATGVAQRGLRVCQMIEQPKVNNHVSLVGTIRQRLVKVMLNGVYRAIAPLDFSNILFASFDESHICTENVKESANVTKTRTEFDDALAFEKSVPVVIEHRNDSVLLPLLIASPTSEPVIKPSLFATPMEEACFYSKTHLASLATSNFSATPI